MTKKLSRFAILTIILLFALTMPVFAREVDVDDIGEQIDELQEKLGVDIDSYYIIGNYVFTSNYELNTRDIMLAARSIQMKDSEEYKGEKAKIDDFLNQMTIHYVERTFDDQYEPTGWEVKDNYVGSTSITNDTKLNIRFIDYEYLKNLYTVTLDTDNGNDYQKSITVEEGGLINQELITGENRPTKAGKQFKEWVKEDGSKWNFESDKVNEPITLKATWYEEVNTDELLKDAESKMTKNEWYSAKFDAESSKLIFTVLDRNEKNSLISNTGITGNIVSILSKENVVSLTMGNTTFTKEDAKQGPGAEGSVWSKFGQELAELTDKESFKEVTLGDLVGKNLTLKITVDDDNARTHKGNTFETYTIEFVYNAKATIGTKIPESDVTELQEKFKYTPEAEGSYSISEKSAGLYEVTGFITEQEGVQGFGDNPSGFYFAYTITLDQGIDVKKAKVRVPTDENGTKYNEATFDENGKATIIMEVNEDEVGDSAKNHYRDIIIDVDGVPTKIRIDFKGLELRKNSKTTLDVMSDDLDLSSFYGWSKSDGYDVTYEATGDATTGKATIKVKGLLPIYEGDESKLPFEDGCKTDYYIAFAVKTNDSKGENTTVTIKDGTEESSWTGKDFDEEKIIYILKHLHPEIDSRQFTVVVDMDGSGTKYNPYTITVDWSELKLQTDSEAKIELNKASQADKTQMENWGYTTPEGQNVTLTGGMLTGKLVEQELTSNDAFGEDNKDGFYFDFTIQPPKGIELDKNKVEITRVKSHTDIGEDLEDGNVLKKFTGADLDDDNNLTVLYRFPKDTKSCVECAGKDACDGSCCGSDGVCDKVLYYVVDWDGADGKEFLPVVYSIDYCGVTFERSSIFTVDALKSTDKEIFGDDGEWYDEANGYSVTVEQDKADAKKYKVKGVLPIFNDETYWEDFDGIFDTTDNLYYLGLVLKLVDTDIISGDETGSINVKFFHDDEGDNHYLKGFDEHFDETGKLYILKSLCENAEDGSTISDDEKVFTITLDLDGDDKNDYTPYTVTIDWSELKLQTESVGNFGNYEVATQENIKDDEQAVKDLNNYGYDFKTSADVKIETDRQEETGHESKKGLTGKIKEQTLNSGTFDEDTGYFVPIKVEFPGKDDDNLSEYAHKWTIILNTEKGETKTYTPTKEEYEQGWVVVLFKIKENAGEDSKKEISYWIDFDGEEFAFIPEKYTINYDDLEFETENKITYKYKDNNGEDKTENVVVYENETVELKDLSEELDTDYRTFAGWYNDSENVSEKDNFTTTENEDVTLTAHWNLNVEKFMKDVIKDLNSDDTKYSDKFDEFKLSDVNTTEDGNEITITVNNPNVSLTELAKTSIPGTIAYILEKNEITGITLTIGEESVEFNSEYEANNEKEYTDDSDRDLLDQEGKDLKVEIVKGAKGVFDTELNDHEADATLDQLEYEGKEFSIKISEVDENVTLVDENKSPITEENDKTYTFKFDSDFAVVNQKPTSELGAKDLSKAVENDKDYSTVYVDGDYTSDTEIDITADHNVTIIPVDSTTGDHITTVKANDSEDVNYAVDIQKGSGTVTIKDLKITGGKRSELRIEDGATVIVDNIDVSGGIDPETSEETEMNSSIIVKGNLTATNVKNENESYACPTISVVTGYATPKDPLKPEDGYPDHDVEGDATVTAVGMKKNDKYCLVDRKTNEKIHTTKETYYGSFYYNNEDNSKIYYAGVMDSKVDSISPYDFIQVYYYGEAIDIKKLGYEPGEKPTSGEDVFQYFEIGDSSSGNRIEDSNQLAQSKLVNHSTTVLHAVYGTKPMSALNFENVSGLSTSGNKVSGTISTQNKEGKFVILVTLTSEKFQEGVSTVKVTDPNGKAETYTYNSSSENGIATVSNANTMKLELEAIKSSKITGNKGKVYEIAVDVDGKEDKYQQEAYTIDYSGVKTLEEKINQAAKATLEANSFTVTKNNKINGYTEEFTYKYNAKDGLTYLKAEKDNVEEYTFSVKYAGVAENSSKLSVVARKKIENEEDSGVYLNDWVYVHPQQVGRAIQEVSMLTDVMKDGKTSINAIDKVSLVDESAHKYKVELNRDKYNDWVTNNYLSNSKYSSAEWALKETVTVYVELDDSEQYIKSIKTSQTSSNNTFDVTFKDVNKTTIKVPTEFFEKEGITLTNEDIKKFYEDGAKWWDKHIHEDAYKQ